MIIFDTETTALPGISALPEDQQPYIIEFAAIKVKRDTLEIVDEIEFLCRPPILPISDEITKITGITSDMVKDKPPFMKFFKDICKFFLGEESMVAHNLPFDRSMLYYELKRKGKVWNFPWPFVHDCTAELTQDIHGKYMKQEDLYKHYMGEDPKQKHRAMSDVMQLFDIVCKMRNEGRI